MNTEAKIINGKKLAAEVRAELARNTSRTFKAGSIVLQK